MATNKPSFFYGYIVVLVSFFIQAIGWGTNNSFGVFFCLTFWLARFRLMSLRRPGVVDVGRPNLTVGGVLSVLGAYRLSCICLRGWHGFAFRNLLSGAWGGGRK